ncbi:hypothetical protein [Microvirga guangxiensis]|uniref:Uncharacterized protein n=1 Tax=Microvirga guangxiensis TaxID=549386 RepID=A0A1G5DVG8_9HYPH|nr:hypothetical protein [Microvirga guangxiensis]SCY18746.1 hypothetical protein SAMN02927923_00796 [Microvirga guangxiensis]
MRREIPGVLVTTAVAPYLTTLLMMVLDLLFLNNAEPRGQLDVFGFISLGTFGLLFFGFPLLFFSSIFALALSKLSRHPPLWLPIMIGSVLGCCFVSTIFSESLERIWTYLVSGTLSGAICGWIYWCIAIRQTPADDRPITTP